MAKEDESMHIVSGCQSIVKEFGARSPKKKPRENISCNVRRKRRGHYDDAIPYDRKLGLPQLRGEDGKGFASPPGVEAASISYPNKLLCMASADHAGVMAAVQADVESVEPGTQVLLRQSGVYKHTKYTGIVVCVHTKGHCGGCDHAYDSHAHTHTHVHAAKTAGILRFFARRKNHDDRWRRSVWRGARAPNPTITMGYRMVGVAKGIRIRAAAHNELRSYIAHALMVSNIWNGYAKKSILIHRKKASCSYAT